MTTRKFAMYFHTLKYVPAKNHVRRIVKRGGIKVCKFFPRLSFWLLSLLSQRKQLVQQGNYSEELLGAILAISANNESALTKITNDDYVFDILAEKRQLNLEEVACQRFGEGNNELWRMNLGYLAYLPSYFLCNAGEERLLYRIVSKFSPQVCWDASAFNSIWHPYSVSHRLINTIWCYLTLEKKLDAADAEGVRRQLSLMVTFLEIFKETELQYNHLTKNYLAISVYFSVFRGRVSAVLEKKIREAILYQIEGDGFHSERSPMYHNLFISDLKVFASCNFSKGFKLWLTNIIRDMESASEVVSHASGRIALFSDSWLGEGVNHAPLRKSNRAELRTLSSVGFTKIQKKDLSLIFNHGDCGPPDNPGHAHSDYLSIELQNKNKMILVDYGVPTYSKGSERDFSRSSGAHNGPGFKGRDAVEFWHSFRVARRSTVEPLQVEELVDGWKARACYSNYDGSGKVSREIVFSESKSGLFIIITDRWEVYKDSVPLLSFLIPAHAITSIDVDGVISLSDGANLRIDCDDMKLSGARFFERYGGSNEATRINIEPLKITPNKYKSVAKFEFNI